MAFEESGDFPANRSELYKEGLDTLLKKWDAKRGIERDKVYKNLSIQRKEDLLSKIALITFEKGDYFFKQKAAEQYIIDYIYNLSDANPDVEALQLDSQTVLRSIEAQHGLLVERAKGIYSFSHLTFHEYFTAREIVFGTQPLEERLQNLVSHITEKRWREVFLLAVGMSPSADYLLLLMKKKVDAIVAADEKLQQFLLWLNQKSCSVKASSKLAAVRAFYFDIALCLNWAIYNLNPNPLVPFFEDSFKSEIALNLGFEFTNYSDEDSELNLDLELSYAFGDAPATANTNNFEINPELKRLLQKLDSKILDYHSSQLFLQNHEEDEKSWQNEWQNEVKNLAEQLRCELIKSRNIGNDWQFNNQQQELLKQYHDANLLLVKCLNSDCYVSREVRQGIEDTLLLPIAEIEQPKRGLM